jgi:hypothetical protein
MHQAYIKGLSWQMSFNLKVCNLKILKNLGEYYFCLQFAFRKFSETEIWTNVALYGRDKKQTLVWTIDILGFLFKYERQTFSIRICTSFHFQKNIEYFEWSKSV